MIHDFSTKKSVNQQAIVSQKDQPVEIESKPKPILIIPKTEDLKKTEANSKPPFEHINSKPIALPEPVVKKNPPISLPPKPILEIPSKKSEVIEDDDKYRAYYKEPEKDKFYEGIRSKEDLTLACVDIEPIIQRERISKDKYEVYRMGDFVEDERKAIMPQLGLDIGTKTIVAAFKNKQGQIDYISEINGFWPFERATPFIENMLKDTNKVRSDGSKRPAHYFKHEESNQLIVLGRDAEEFAYSKNDTLKRPMAEGGITPDELSMTVLSSIIHGILATAEKDLGKFDSNLTLCYCTTAPALNKKNNIEYHERVMDIILKSYNSESNIKLHKIKESHAIVLNMSPDGTGIGISWGAGTVTVTYVKYGLEVYSFCWVGAGDWIDENVAIRHGYDPHAMKTMRKASKETPTTVAKAKMNVDLTPGTTYDDRLLLDISLHYDVLINQVINGIIAGFQEHEAEARIEDGVNVYMAGGTSSPKGFAERVAHLFSKNELPFVLGNVSRSDKPLFTVAGGCLTAAEMY
jgi:hypothetical protein